MYNRYVPGNDGYIRVVMDEESVRGTNAARGPRRQHAQKKRYENTGAKNGAQQDLFQTLKGSLGFVGGEESKNAGMAGILKGLHLEELDSGDILLLLILLLVFLEGDNTELVITLGLILLLGLGGEKQSDQNE